MTPGQSFPPGAVGGLVAAADVFGSSRSVRAVLHAVRFMREARLLDLPGPSRRITVEPLRLPVPLPDPPPAATPDRRLPAEPLPPVADPLPA
jgi:hypothetical protein